MSSYLSRNSTRYKFVIRSKIYSDFIELAQLELIRGILPINLSYEYKIKLFNISLSYTSNYFIKRLSLSVRSLQLTQCGIGFHF
jgi:hypothetical protein